MICNKCGGNVSENDKFCNHCGELSNPVSAPYENPSYSYDNNSAGSTYGYPQIDLEAKRKRNKVIFALLAVIVAVILAIVAVNYYKDEMAKDQLQSQLLRDWERVESGESIIYTLELDFSDGTIDYNFVYYGDEDLIETMSYEVISGNKIKIDGIVHEISFSEDKEMMIVSPAITSPDTTEYWFHFED